jgi:hypothetical protein
MSESAGHAEKTKHIAKAILKNLATLLALGSAMYLLWLGGRSSVSAEEYLRAILRVLVFLSLKLIVDGVVEALETDPVDALSTKFDKVMSKCDRSYDLVATPKEPPEYFRMFGGFDGTYRAYNPAFLIESDNGDHWNKLMESVFVPRYAGGTCRAQYLFLTGDTAGQRNLDEFARRFTGDKRAKKYLQYIEVRRLDAENAQGHPEVYWGKQNLQPTTIIEVVEPGRLTGRPVYYLVSTDEGMWNRISDEFVKVWTDPRTRIVDVAAHAAALGATATTPATPPGTSGSGANAPPPARP